MGNRSGRPDREGLCGAISNSLGAMKRYFVMLLPAVLGALPLQGAPTDAAGIEFFERNIRATLVEQCYLCHSAEARKVKGGLLLDTSDGLLKGGDNGAVIVPGDPNHSRLIE